MAALDTILRTGCLAAALALSAAVAERAMDRSWMSIAGLHRTTSTQTIATGLILSSDAADDLGPNRDALLSRLAAAGVVVRIVDDRLGAADAAESLSSDRRVDLLVAACDSAQRASIDAVARRYGVPCVSILPTVPLSAADATVDLGGTPNQRIAPAVAWAARALGRRIAVVTVDAPMARVTRRIAASRLAAEGAEAVADVVLGAASGDAEVAEAVARLHASSPDAILLDLPAPLASRVLASLRGRPGRASLTPCVHCSVDVRRLLASIGAAAAGDYIAGQAALGDDRADGRPLGDRLEAVVVGVKAALGLAAPLDGGRDASRARAALRAARSRCGPTPLLVDPVANAAWMSAALARIDAAGKARSVIATEPLRPARSYEGLGEAAWVAVAQGDDAPTLEANHE